MAQSHPGLMTEELLPSGLLNLDFIAQLHDSSKSRFFGGLVSGLTIKTPILSCNFCFVSLSLHFPTWYLAPRSVIRTKLMFQKQIPVEKKKKEREKSCPLLFPWQWGLWGKNVGFGRWGLNPAFTTSRWCNLARYPTSPGDSSVFCSVPHQAGGWGWALTMLMYVSARLSAITGFLSQNQTIPSLLSQESWESPDRWGHSTAPPPPPPAAFGIQSSIDS